MLKEKVSSIRRIITDPAYRLESLRAHGFYDHTSDEEFLKKKFRVRMGYDLNLDDPKTFNEKLQWLKIHDRKPEYSTMVDKYEVKGYVAGLIGEEYVIPSYGVWDRFDDIDFDRLPDRFVLKCTHDSGGLVIVKDKNKLDIPAARIKIEKSLKRDFYRIGREWPYKNVRHRVLAEQLLIDEARDVLIDYKVLCFNGEPKLIEVHQGRYSEHHTQDFYDTDWNLTEISQAEDPRSFKPTPRPVVLEEMVALSRVLAKGHAHIRVDWYVIKDRLYFGELTFFDGDGLSAFDNPADDLMLGEWIDLTKV